MMWHFQSNPINIRIILLSLIAASSMLIMSAYFLTHQNVSIDTSSSSFYHSTYRTKSPLPLLILDWDRRSTLLAHAPYATISEIPIKQKRTLPGCSCEVTNDPAAWKIADAVMVNAFYLRIIKNFSNFFPQRRDKQQYWIFFNMEPAQLMHDNRDAGFFHHLNHQFNLTMTYRHDSGIDLLPQPSKNETTDIANAFVDVPISYGRLDPIVVNYPTTKGPPDPKLHSNSSKTHLAAWFVSNCHAKSARMELVRELQKYIPIDIYGACGPLKCPNETVKNCSQMLQNKYKFYLSLESSICDDYVSEKFYNALQQNVVPIALHGSHDDSRHYPKNLFIDVRNFTSIKDLAEYIRKLDNSPVEYNAYHEWKEKWKVVRQSYGDTLCDLCRKLQKIHKQQPTFHKVYPDMMQWWHEKGHCRRGAVVNGTWKIIP